MSETKREQRTRKRKADSSAEADGESTARNPKKAKGAAFKGKYQSVVMDIEGTTTPIVFVKTTLFPFAKERVAQFLEAHWDEDATKDCLVGLAEQSALDAKNGVAGVVAVPRIGEADAKAVREAALQNVYWQMSLDRKTFALKSLQVGLVCCRPLVRRRLSMLSGCIAVHSGPHLGRGLQERRAQGRSVRRRGAGSQGLARERAAPVCVQVPRLHHAPSRF